MLLLKLGWPFVYVKCVLKSLVYSMLNSFAVEISHVSPVDSTVLVSEGVFRH